MNAKHAYDIIDNRRKAFPQKFTLTGEPVLRIYSIRSPANRKLFVAGPGTEWDTGTGQASEI